MEVKIPVVEIEEEKGKDVEDGENEEKKVTDKETGESGLKSIY